jgi:mRNA interferase MazF
MSPRHGEVWLVDMGLAAKVRPCVVLLADNLNAPRSLIIQIPITRQSRGTELEIKLGHLPFLDPDSVANVQGVAALPSVRFERRLGALPPTELAAVKIALARACAL